MKILAVDDDEFILELLFEAMGATGYPDVTLASSGAKALELMHSSDTPFECFLLDIQMPEMDGIELCGEIRNDPAYRKTPIIMLTAMSERNYIDRAFAAGATDYVTKPFDVLELAARVGMAERLNTEMSKAQESFRTIDALTERLVAERTVELDNPVDVEDVDGFLNFRAFENYIAMLGRGSYFSSSLLALRIENIRAIHKACNATDFEFAITDFAEAISDNFSGNSRFFTYAGNGIYVCVYNRIKDPVAEDLCLRIQDSVVQMNLVFANGNPIEIRIVPGAIKNPGVFSKPGSLEVLQSAIKSLETAYLEDRVTHASSEFALKTQNPRKWLPKSGNSKYSA